MATVEKRLQADGTVSFRAKIRIKGALPQTASFARLTDARKWAQSAEAAIREGRHFGYQETKRHTVTDLIDRYARDVLRQDSPDVDNRKRQLVWWKGKIGHLTLADITPALIAEHRDKLLKEPIVSQAKNPDPKKPVRYRSNSTVVRYLAAISHAFTIAIKEWQWLENNPVQRIRKPKEARGRDRFLSDEERTNLLESCKASECAVLYTIVVLALSTGMRRGEIMTLNWKHVDFKNKAVRLEQTKNGDKRTVPLTGHAHELLTALSKVRRIDTQMVFPSTSGNTPLFIDRPWRKALSAAGVEDFCFHDLRHSAASYLAMNGASLIEIAAVLGHRTMQMVKRYSHIAESHTHKVVTSMNDKIFAGTEKSEVQHGS